MAGLLGKGGARRSRPGRLHEARRPDRPVRGSGPHPGPHDLRWPRAPGAPSAEAIHRNHRPSVPECVLQSGEAMSFALPPRRLVGEPGLDPEWSGGVFTGEIASLVADIPLPMWVYDTVTLRIEAANAAALRVYGYARSEFLALTADGL